MSYSYSQISAYRTCPRQYEYAFVKKLKRQISEGESFGSSVHNTLKKWGELEMMQAKGADTRHDQLKLFVSQTPHEEKIELTEERLLMIWHESFIVEGYPTRVEADYRRKTGEQVMRNFYEWWKRKDREVIAVEKGFKWEQMDSTVITGRFDRVERMDGGLRIIDFKTGSPRTQEKVDNDLQLSIYALAAKNIWESEVEELALLFLGEEDVMEMKTMRTPGQLQDAQKNMRSITDLIETKDFHPTPSRNICKYCPYSGVCDVAAV